MAWLFCDKCAHFQRSEDVARRGGLCECGNFVLEKEEEERKANGVITISYLELIELINGRRLK